MKHKRKTPSIPTIRIPLFNRQIGPKGFLVIFLAMIVAITILIHSLFSFYVQLFNDGKITDMQALSLGGATLAAVIGATVFVGVRYILHLKKMVRIGSADLWSYFIHH